MPNKSLPAIGESNWGVTLNNHLSQLLNPITGGINTFEQFSSRPTNLTTDDSGKTYLYTQTGNIHQWNGSGWKVLNEAVINVKDYGAIGDGVVDDTVAIQIAADLKLGNLYFPKGVYLCNIILNGRFVVSGTNSVDSIITPFDLNKAAITYISFAPYFSYASEIRNLGFKGLGTKTGIGFTFGRSNILDYNVSDEYIGNVKFYGCYFTNLDKGFQCLFGNIGSEFYSCGFASNKYGVYCLNKKNTNTPDPYEMQSTCKYFYAGEFNSNDCAVYFHDTSLAFGGLNFRSTIFEINAVASYIYCINTNLPITYDDCWIEGNGNTNGVAPATVELDSWNGITKTSTTFPKRAFIFEGKKLNCTFNGGNPGDIHLKSRSSKVVLNHCRVESKPGYDGYPSKVDYNDSYIKMISPITYGGVGSGKNIVVVDSITYPDTSDKPIGDNGTAAVARSFNTLNRTHKVTNYTGNSKLLSISFATASTSINLNGSFAVNHNIVVDGILYGSCAEYVATSFASDQYLQVAGSDISMITGWYIFTIDIKIILGNPRFYIWNRNDLQFANYFSPPTLNEWYTFAGIGYCDGSIVGNVFLDTIGSNENCTWRLSSLQIHRFDNILQAEAFLKSLIFTE